MYWSDLSVQLRHGILFWLFSRIFLLEVGARRFVGSNCIFHRLGKFLKKKRHNQHGGRCV